MNNEALTPEQRRFSEDNHYLIGSFLRWKRLSPDYYDIIVFGYLRAVKKYFNRPELRQYKFKTIAYRDMYTDLINHYRKNSRPKRKAYIVSLDTAIYGRDENLTLMETVGVEDNTADNIAYDSLLSEISSVLSKDQFNIVRMRAEGYTDREIAKHQNIPVHSLQETLLSIREILAPSLV
jgi:RNA polymerase sigma-70 factor (ECF subfamily)